jgi:hypothetical protein
MSTTFPNGQTLTSSALTPDSFLAAFQLVTAQILGLNPQNATDPAYAKVRLDWPTSGQPAWAITDDIAFLGAREEESDFSKIRDRAYGYNNPQSLTATYTYTRVWRVSWKFYGPNSFDHARLTNDALFLDWVHDALAASQLYLVDSGRPQYAPELFSAQWWKRTDLSARYNELVTATIVDSSIASAEVIVYNRHGLVADVSAQQS